MRSKARAARLRFKPMQKTAKPQVISKQSKKGEEIQERNNIITEKTLFAISDYKLSISRQNILSTFLQRDKRENCRVGFQFRDENRISICIFAIIISHLKFKENFVVSSKSLSSYLYVPSQQLETPQQ